MGETDLLIHSRFLAYGMSSGAKRLKWFAAKEPLLLDELSNFRWFLTLPLHRPYPAMLRNISAMRNQLSSGNPHRKEHPLEHLAILVGLIARIERESARGVVMLAEVEQDGRSFKHCEVVPVAINQDWYAPVRVQLDEPRLLLRVLGDADRMDTTTQCCGQRRRRLAGERMAHDVTRERSPYQNGNTTSSTVPRHVKNVLARNANAAGYWQKSNATTPAGDRKAQTICKPKPGRAENPSSLAGRQTGRTIRTSACSKAQQRGRHYR